MQRHHKRARPSGIVPVQGDRPPRARRVKSTRKFRFNVAVRRTWLPSGSDPAHRRRPSRTVPLAARIATALLMLATAACSNPQSALAPAGMEAERVARLFWVMAAGAAVVWTAVLGFALYATRAQAERHGPRAARWLIIGGGVVTPTIVLAALLVYGLRLMPPLREPATPGSVRVDVSGEQWWWRVRYRPAGGEAVELANEIRLPVGQRTEFRLVSPDVIHSFWIPALGGKVDMIPGHVNTLVLEPQRTGVFRGACAEFCGASHAYMEFVVEVMEPEAFSRWLRHQAAPAQPPSTATARRGRDAFVRNGCGGCHTVRGTSANGPLGPDLTHVGSRLSLAAGTLPNTPPAFRTWIARTHAVKPEVLMPSFDMLPPQELDDIAAYLESLQ
jgi:cytochrome c oxidase subunit 2